MVENDLSPASPRPGSVKSPVKIVLWGQDTCLAWVGVCELTCWSWPALPVRPAPTCIRRDVNLCRCFSRWVFVCECYFFPPSRLEEYFVSLAKSFFSFSRLSLLFCFFSFFTFFSSPSTDLIDKLVDPRDKRPGRQLLFFQGNLLPLSIRSRLILGHLF